MWSQNIWSKSRDLLETFPELSVPFAPILEFLKMFVVNMESRLHSMEKKHIIPLCLLHQLEHDCQKKTNLETNNRSSLLLLVKQKSISQKEYFFPIVN